MSYRSKYFGENSVSLVVTVALLVLTFSLIGFVALSVLTGNNFGLGPGYVSDDSTPGPAAAESAVPAGTPDPSAMVSFESPALGFSLKYPRTWRKSVKGLRVGFSPSTAGLNPEDLQDVAIWFGIPADDSLDAADLLTRLQADLVSHSHLLNRETRIIGAEPWESVKLSYDDQDLGGSAIASLATTSRNQVGYFIIAVAPADQWDSIQPIFRDIEISFHFTTEAVLRPTDATPPPTPTPTPTPVIHIIQAGDTLSHIAAQYGVTIDALSTRNSIDDPRTLRVGAKLIIPIKRR